MGRMTVEDAAFQPFALQTGTNGEYEQSSFAVSMYYNEHNQEVTITGGTYSDFFHPGAESNKQLDPDCFVAILRIRQDGRVGWVRRKQFGNPSVSEFCSDIQIREGKGAVMVGHSADGGILSHLLPYGDERRSVYGMILDLDDGVELMGGNLMHANEIEYPVAVSADSSGDEVYVASMFTDGKPDGSALQYPFNTTLYPGGSDLSATGYSIPLQDMNFSLRVQQFTSLSEDLSTNSSGISKTLHAGWSRNFGTVNMKNVQVSSLDYISSSALLVTGYTNGNGTAFGQPSHSSAESLDGYVILLDPSSGHMIHTKRVESVLPGEDKILGSCSVNSSEVYLVGTTTGLFDSTYVYEENGAHLANSTYAFIQKLDLNDMSIVWSRQIGGILPTDIGNEGAQVQGLACATTSDGEEVYLVGNVMDGGSVFVPNQPALESAGSTDVFVSKFDTSTGTLQYVIQLGSTGEDTVASGSCVSTDGDGNLIVLGNTDGGMFRQKTSVGIFEPFLMSIGRASGDYVMPIGKNSLAQGSRNGGLLDKIFAGRQMDPLRRARYENAFAALLTLLCLGLVAAIVMMFVRRRKMKGAGKGLEQSTLHTHSSGSDDGESVGSRASFTKIAIETIDSTANTKVQTVDRYLWSGNVDTDETTNSVLSVVGRRRSQHAFIPGHRRVAQPSGKSKPTPWEADTPSAYGEVYDLLSTASAKLSLGSDMESTLPPPPPRTRKQGQKDEALSLDDIWNSELV